MTWTLVSDRTPEPGQTVLAWWPPDRLHKRKEGWYDVTLFDEDTWCQQDVVCEKYTTPYAWAALPPPPEMNI